jgi:hypothetical protein
LVCLFPVTVHGRGKTEADEKEPLNKEWTLCITSFDVSSLPNSQQILGSILERNLVSNLVRLDRRVRDTGEYAWYERVAWSAARVEAGRNLGAKRGERDMLLYKGLPRWKYRAELKRIDKEILALEEVLARVEAEMPPIAAEPAFKLAERNTAGTFPLPPEAGREEDFLKEAGTDAFLNGKISDMYGRLHVEVQMYTRHGRSFQYEDSTIFSPEDMDEVMMELTGRVMAAVSGLPRAAIVVRVEPEDAMILINGAFAGRGETAELGQTPGSTEVQISAENHDTFSVSLDLIAGEIAEMYVELQPLALQSFIVSVPEDDSGKRVSVYLGAQYIGDAPVNFEVPLDRYQYILVETEDGNQGKLIAQGSSDSDLTSPREMVIHPQVLPDKNERPVDTMRRKFYGAYGRLWVTLPLAFLISGLSTAYTNANTSSTTGEMNANALMWNRISIGAWGVAGLFAVEVVYRLIRYVSTTSKDAVLVAE